MIRFIVRIMGVLFLLIIQVCSADDMLISVPKTWSTLQPIVESRVTQKRLKMKLQLSEANGFIEFLKAVKTPTPELVNLQRILPKTTLELLMAVHKRGLALEEAEKMAHCLSTIIEQFNFKNIKPFDENTSHIIGREWHEIDYSGENMTWQKQQQKYKPYGIKNFKSAALLVKFFKIECQMPYFKKTYQPKNRKSCAL